MSWKLDDEVTTTYGTIVQAHREATEQERERIIKLLEAMREKHIPWCGATDCIDCEQTIGIEKAIALIKGENK